MRVGCLLIVMLLSGCARNYWVCPPPPVLERPVLQEIKPDQPDNEKVRGMVLIVEALETYARQLEQIVEGYR